MPIKIVFSGGPFAGKTESVKALAEKGFTTIPEAATTLVKELKEKDQDANTNDQVFNNLLWEKYLENEKNLEKGKTYIMDRSIIDFIGFAKLYNLTLPENWEQVYQQAKYKLVFMPEILPNYQQSQKKENEAAARKVHGIIKQLYEKTKHKIITLPIENPEKRLTIILEELKNQAT